jgi:hypothetical protein
MTTVGFIGSVLVGGAVLGVITELVLRAVLRRSGYYVWPRLFRRVMTPHIETFPQLEPLVAFNVNSDGERAAEFVPGTSRVLVAGGSSVECALNDQHSAWTGQLELLLGTPEAKRRLGAAGAHVGNIGRSGMDVTAIDIILDRTLPRYGPLEAVALMVGPGDLMRWLEAGAPPGVPLPPIPIDSMFGEHPELAFGWKPARTALAEVVRRIRRLWLRPVDRREQTGKWMGRARVMRQQAQTLRTDLPDATVVLDQFEAGLRRAVQRAQRASKRVVLVRQPSFRKDVFTAVENALFWNGGVGNAYRGDAVTVFFDTHTMYRLLDQFEARIEKVARETGALFCDPMPTLPMDTTVFFDHFHLTAKGNAVVATVAARTILEAAVEGAARTGVAASNGAHHSVGE